MKYYLYIDIVSFVNPEFLMSHVLQCKPSFYQIKGVRNNDVACLAKYIELLNSSRSRKAHWAQKGKLLWNRETNSQLYISSINYNPNLFFETTKRLVNPAFGMSIGWFMTCERKVLAGFKHSRTQL